MKWVILLIALCSVPPLAFWFRGNRKAILKAYAFLGFLPFVVTATPALDIALVSTPSWLGFTHGVEITALDILAAAIYLALPRRSERSFRYAFLLYFSAVAFSIVQASSPAAASFYLWQLARIYLLFIVVAHGSNDEKGIFALLHGMGAGLLLQGLVVVWQRYELGLLQAYGTFVHQNSLGMASHFVISPYFALLLAGHVNWRFSITPMVGAIVAALTASRAALGLTALSIFTMYTFSCMRELTALKARLAFAAMFVGAIIAPIAVDSLQARFAAVPLSTDYDERAAFNRAASMIAEDYPFGVGANHYVLLAKQGGYSERAGVLSAEMSRNALVHNVYWLVVTETGFFGLIAFLCLLIRPLTVAVLCAIRNPNDIRGDLSLGFGVALGIVYIHSMYEWVLLAAQTQYLFAITIGMIAGLAKQTGYWQPSRA